MTQKNFKDKKAYTQSLKDTRKAALIFATDQYK